MIVTDDSGTLRNTSTDTLKVILNSPPIADAGADQIGAPGQQLSFDASGSIDPDGNRMGFFWDFGDAHTASGVRVAHRYAKPGIYTVSLMVKEEAGGAAAVGYDEVNVTINTAPIADAGHDVLAAPGEVVALSAARSYDLDGKIVSYRWQFSDSDHVVEQMQSHKWYRTPGVYTARVMVTDDSGAPNNTAQDEVTIHINHPPKSVPGRDTKTHHHAVDFDASDSVDPDGHALTYTWNLGDGSPPKQGVKIIHTYAMGGQYPVVLTVDDGTGLSNAKDAASMTVTIDRPPMAVAGSDQTVCTKDVIVFDGSNSRDPEGGLLRYLWTFGDEVEAEGVNPTHVYTKEGIYPVTLTVQDDSGFSENSHSDRFTVKVDEAPVAVAGPDQSACTNTQVFFDGSASRDADGTVNRFIWDFGDGSQPREGARISHLYAEPGTYRVTLTIVGDQIGECDDSDTDELMVTVADAPLVHVAAPDMASVEESITFNASVANSVLLPIVSWQWDFS
ncbi:MAG: PKD domain-containing protein, partial [Candidatus Tectomicrobia bacterium]|nr:PKD domain-containing protein [Candidatus Tectomicrobia bacterium]